MANLNPNEPVPALWWKPETGRRVAAHGLYELKENGTTLATLHEPLGEYDHPIMADEQEFDILHGEAFGTIVTLLNPRQIRSRKTFGGRLGVTTYRPRLALEGLHLSSAELAITDAKVRFHDQEAWSQAATVQMEVAEGEVQPSVIRLLSKPSLVSQVHGGTVEVKRTSRWRLSVNEARASSHSSFLIRLDSPCPIQEFMRKWILPLEVFIATATGRVGGVAHLEVTNREWRFEGVPDGVEVPEYHKWARVRVGSKKTEGANLKEIKSHDSLFLLQDMNWQTQAPLIFKEIANLQYVTEHWAMLLSPQYSWPLARFISSVQAVEALDRIIHPEEFSPMMADDEIAEVIDILKSAGKFNSRKRQKIKGTLKRNVETPLDQRLRRLAELIDPVVADICPEQDWHSRVARLRNIVSHGLPQSADLTLDIRPVQVATEILLHLLEGTILRRLGFAQEDIASIMKRRSKFEWRREVVTDNYTCLPQV